MIVKILTHLYLEKWENFWKNQGILSVKKSGNPDWEALQARKSEHELTGGRKGDLNIVCSVQTVYKLIVIRN